MNDDQIKVVVTLLKKMNALNVLVHPAGVIDGPVVTGYRFTVPDTLPLAKLYAKSEDLALASGVEVIDIRRIGHEVILFVPNKERRVVDFKEALFWYLKDPAVGAAQLPLLLGVDYKGAFSFLELAEMPHVLIAGSTGSGKSVFLSSMIAAISTKYASTELHLYLVDTKNLDLPLFHGLPHAREIVKEIRDWYPVYNRLWREYENRKAEFSRAGVRNIREFHGLGLKMPFILLVIDELADLIEHDKAFREEAKRNESDHDEAKIMDALKRLLQVCRAAGIHVIAGTQRTSVDIVTGTVKANFPCRISLRLPTAFDSRTILGEQGAENLLGKGDMLVKMPDADALVRFHGPFVKLEDIAAILADQNMIKQMLGV
jgi:DNA segregation ATPase FtsK/SpoIIIE, S-DNA-T family